jgi:hypothetical protein
VNAEVVHHPICSGRSAGARKPSRYASKTSLVVEPSTAIDAPIPPSRVMLATRVVFYGGEADIEQASSFTLSHSPSLDGVDDLPSEVFGVGIHLCMMLHGSTS